MFPLCMRRLLPLVLAAALPAAAQAAFYAAAGKVDITPDVAHRRVWLAGFGDSGRRARGVHDPLYARAVVLSDGHRTVALVALDLIGFYRQQVLRIRDDLQLDPAKEDVIVASIHTHSGPDTLGLWGPYQGISGVDPAYLAEVRERVESLLRTLSRSLQEAELVSSVRPIEMHGLCMDTRDPVVMDPYLAALQLRGVRDGSVIGTVVDWSCHPELLDEDNDLVTPDFPAPLCDKIEKDTGDTCVYFSGALGGMQTPDKPDLERGGRTPWQADRFLGESVAAAAEKELRQGTVSRPSALRFWSKTVKLPVDNSKFLTFLPLLSFGHDLYAQDGKKLSSLDLYLLSLKHALFRLKPSQLPMIETEVQRLDIGPVEIVTLPGELLPELLVGGYDGKYRYGYPLISPDNPAPPDLAKAPKGPYLYDQMLGGQKFVIGLANDEIGYIIPEYDFKTSAALLMEPFPPGDHYEESNSLGKKTAGILLDAARELLRRK